MSGEGDEAERLQVLEQYRKKVRNDCNSFVVSHKSNANLSPLFVLTQQGVSLV